MFPKTVSISMSKRFELALYAFIANGAPSDSEHSNQHSCFERGASFPIDSVVSKGKNVVDEFSFRSLDRKLGRLDLEDDLRNASDDVSVPLAEGVSDLQRGFNLMFQQSANPQTSFGRTSTSVVEKTEGSGVAIKGPSEEPYHLSNDSWLSGADSRNSPVSGVGNDWRNGGASALTWGGRVVGTKQVTGCLKGKWGLTEEEYNAFVNTFEGGSLLYCNMSFEVLLNARKQLEELGFPCKAVNDGLWLQVICPLNLLVFSFS